MQYVASFWFSLCDLSSSIGIESYRSEASTNVDTCVNAGPTDNNIDTGVGGSLLMNVHVHAQWNLRLSNLILS